MTTARRSALLVTIASLLLSSVAAAADETIDRVKDLYRTAAYEEALAVLDQMAKDQASANPTEASEYRLLCLIALERRTEAHDAIAAMVNADPFYQPSQVSPRVRTMFRDVRQSLLPGIVQRAYAEAKTAFDRKDPKSSSQFDHVLTLLDDPDIAGVPTLGDLRTVVTAFRDLSNALAPRPEPAPRSVAAAAPASASAALTRAARTGRLSRRRAGSGRSRGAESDPASLDPAVSVCAFGDDAARSTRGPRSRHRREW